MAFDEFDSDAAISVMIAEGGGVFHDIEWHNQQSDESLSDDPPLADQIAHSSPMTSIRPGASDAA